MCMTEQRQSDCIQGGMRNKNSILTISRRLIAAGLVLSLLSCTVIDAIMGGCPANTKRLYIICTLLDQRRRRVADVVQMLYKYFVFAGWFMYKAH